MKCGLLALANGLVDRIWVATVAIALIELVTTMTGLEEFDCCGDDFGGVVSCTHSGLIDVVGDDEKVIAGATRDE